MRLEISGRSIVGSKEPQQDSWRVFNARGEDISNRAAVAATAGDGTLVIVADGIGGYAGGEIASKLACDAFGATFFEAQGSVRDRLGRALEAANAAIGDEKRRRPDLQDMGCTLIAVHFDRDRMTFISVGDSLLLRSRDDEIHRVNMDHSYFEYLDRLVLGSDDPQRWSVAVQDTRRRASLTIAVTGGELVSAEFGHRPQVATRPLQPDDIIILASDGIETLDMVQLQNFLHTLRPNGVQGVADGLIRAVDGIGKTRSYQDNTTIVVVAALEGAGLTRVARRPGYAVVAEPADYGALARERILSFLPVLSRKTLALGVGSFGIALLLLLVVFGADRRSPKQPEGPPPASVEAPAKKGQPVTTKDQKRRTDSDAPAPDDQTPDQNAGPPPNTSQQQGSIEPAAEPSATTPSDSASQPHVNPPVAIADAPAKSQQGHMRSLKPDYAFQGSQKSPVPASDSGKCTLACLDDASCVAFTFHADGRCELFFSQAKLVAEKGALSGQDKAP
jgi:PPM family protein phosphatase